MVLVMATAASTNRPFVDTRNGTWETRVATGYQPVSLNQHLGLSCATTMVQRHLETDSRFLLSEGRLAYFLRKVTC